ncbi:hypothetical protein GCM10020331_057920 [Ectobacillus funiculus]
MSPTVVIIGSAITKAANPKAAAKQIKRIYFIDRGESTCIMISKSILGEIQEVLDLVDTNAIEEVSRALQTPTRIFLL